MDKTAQKIHEQRSSVASTFQDKWDQAFENAKFFRMIQYTDKQLQRFAAQNRVPYVLDYITLILNTQLGDQRDNRTDITYYPVESGDDVRAELLNVVKDAALRNNNWIYTESDIFQDGLIEKMGAVGYEWSYDSNPLGELKLFRIPPRQLTWDLNRRDFDLSKSLWVSRARLYGKRELKKKYPKFSKQIDKLSFTPDDMEGVQLDVSYYKQINDSDLSATALIEYYEKDYSQRYFIQNKDSGLILDGFYTKSKDAEVEIRKRLDEYDGLVSQMIGKGIELPSERPTLEVLPFEYPIIRKSEVANNLVFVDEEETDYPDYPYDAYYPFWHDGEWWGLLDLYKDPQRFINKMFSSVDHQIQTNSKGMLFVDETIPDAQFQQIKEAWSKTGAAMRIKDPAHNIYHVPPASFDPRLLSAMDVAIMNIEKKAGGSNFMGSKESSAESGTAINQRIQRGSVASFPVFDNLDRFKLSVGAKIAWFLSHYMTKSQKIRIEGEDLTNMAQKEFPDWFKQGKVGNYGFLEINTTENNSLSELKVDIIIDKSRHSVTKNQNILAQLSMMMQSSPLLAETIPPQMLIQLFDIPASIKRKMTEQAEQLLQAKLAKDQAEVTRPPSLSGSLGDITLFADDPQAQMQWAQKFGVQISGAVKQDSKTPDMLMKAMIDERKQKTDLAFKQGKHDEQIAVTSAKALSQIDLEREKLEVQKQQKKNNGSKEN